MEHESGSAAKRSRAETSTTYSYRKDPTVPFFSDQHPIIVYDGLCALCSGWVSIVLRYDHRRRFRLVPAQAPLGQALYRHYGLDPENFESNMLIEEGEVWLKSEACLRMAAGLGSFWPILGWSRILPLRWRDRAYDHLARRRLRFGRRKTCFLGNEDQRDRFLV
ncbi:MAG TPA: DCC1-like thiol-disulfide oxidoreductase family protein [Dongiaceae bacterium]